MWFIKADISLNLSSRDWSTSAITRAASKHAAPWMQSWHALQNGVMSLPMKCFALADEGCDFALASAWYPASRAKRVQPLASGRLPLGVAGLTITWFDRLVAVVFSKNIDVSKTYRAKPCSGDGLVRKIVARISSTALMPPSSSHCWRRVVRPLFYRRFRSQSLVCKKRIATCSSYMLLLPDRS